MPRDIPVSNGRLLVNFDASYQLRDFYYPHVGKENHSGGHPFRFGVWSDGRFSWVHSDEWQKSLRFQNETLVTEVTPSHPQWQLRLVCHDAVDFHEDVYLRLVKVQDQSGREREVRLFFCQDFHIYENEVGDTAYFRPDDLSLVHYKDERYFFINCCTEQKCGWHPRQPVVHLHTLVGPMVPREGEDPRRAAVRPRDSAVGGPACSAQRCAGRTGSPAHSRRAGTQRLPLDVEPRHLRSDGARIPGQKGRVSCLKTLFRMPARQTQRELTQAREIILQNGETKAKILIPLIVK